MAGEAGRDNTCDGYLGRSVTNSDDGTPRR